MSATKLLWTAVLLSVGIYIFVVFPWWVIALLFTGMIFLVAMLTWLDKEVPDKSEFDNILQAFKEITPIDKILQSLKCLNQQDVGALAQAYDLPPKSVITKIRNLEGVTYNGPLEELNKFEIEEVFQALKVVSRKDAKALAEMYDLPLKSVFAKIHKLKGVTYKESLEVPIRIEVDIALQAHKKITPDLAEALAEDYNFPLHFVISRILELEGVTYIKPKTLEVSRSRSKTEEVKFVESLLDCTPDELWGLERATFRSLEKIGDKICFVLDNRHGRYMDDVEQAQMELFQNSTLVAPMATLTKQKILKLS